MILAESTPGPEMVASVGIVLSGISVLVALVLLGFNLADRRREATESRRAQASRIRISMPTSSTETNSDGRLQVTWASTVSNDSQDVASRVTATLRLVALEEDPSGVVEGTSPWVVTFKRIDPGRSQALEHTYDLPRLGDGAPPKHDATVTLSFTDAGGRRWSRDDSHQLREITDEPT